MGALLSEPMTAMVVERFAHADFLTAASASMQGWRRSHEDAHIFRMDPSKDCGVFAILDGHGGDVCAHMASELLQHHLTRLGHAEILDASAAEEKLQTAFIDTDLALRSQLPAQDTSGTTVVAAVIRRQYAQGGCRPKYRIHIAHSGDSRAIFCSSKRLVCTVDHKPENATEMQRIQAAGGSVQQGSLGGPQRVDGSLATSRALGDFSFKPADMDPRLCKVTALPDVQTLDDCSPGDWLLLACDGIFDVMTNEEVQEFISTRIQGAASESGDGGDIVVQLLTCCLEKGSKDNCSACLVQLHSDGSTKPYSRVLLEGQWKTAKPAEQVKYAKFFALYGFSEEAKRIKHILKKCAHPKCTFIGTLLNPQDDAMYCCAKCRDTPFHFEPQHGPKCDQLPSATDGGVVNELGPLWIVVGGTTSSGILVREESSLDSTPLGRLSTGATIRSLKVQRGRLQYTKVQGEGPWAGWVSLKLHDKDLVRRAN